MRHWKLTSILIAPTAAFAVGEIGPLQHEKAQAQAEVLVAEAADHLADIAAYMSAQSIEYGLAAADNPFLAGAERLRAEADAALAEADLQTAARLWRQLAPVLQAAREVARLNAFIDAAQSTYAGNLSDANRKQLERAQKAARQLYESDADTIEKATTQFAEILTTLLPVFREITAPYDPEVPFYIKTVADYHAAQFARMAVELARIALPDAPYANPEGEQVAINELMGLFYRRHEHLKSQIDYAPRDVLWEIKQSKDSEG